MDLTTITREEFDARLAQSTEQMRQRRLALEAQAAELEELIGESSAVLERLKARQGEEDKGETMTAYQIYEQAVKPLSVEEKLAIARLIMDEVVPNPAPEPSVKHSELTTTSPSQFGCGRHLLSGAGIDVNELLAVPIDDMFSEYMPKDK